MVRFLNSRGVVGFALSEFAGLIVVGLLLVMYLIIFFLSFSGGPQTELRDYSNIGVEKILFSTYGSGEQGEVIFSKLFEFRSYGGTLEDKQSNELRDLALHISNSAELDSGDCFYVSLSEVGEKYETTFFELIVSSGGKVSSGLSKFVQFYDSSAVEDSLTYFHSENVSRLHLRSDGDSIVLRSYSGGCYG